MRTKPTCFVIMPMSDVPGVALESQWDQVYKTLFKPTIGSAGFHCLRSNADVGNFVSGIMGNLWSADAVLADLTGQKANVCYELGVRHALQGRTILIARRKKDIPSDLWGYARHIYDPRTRKGRIGFKRSVAALLDNIRDDPDRRDNPVEDFLQDSQRLHGRLRMSHLNQPQREACEQNLASCRRAIEKITAGAVPIPGGAGYLTYFMDLIESGPAHESVKVFLNTMPENDALKYNMTVTKQLFKRLARLVERGKMRIEYTCLFHSRAHYEAAGGREVLERHRPFAYSVRRVLAREDKVPLPNVGKTIVLMEKRAWAITHDWNSEGHVANACLFVNRDDYQELRNQYQITADRSVSLSKLHPRGR